MAIARKPHNLKYTDLCIYIDKTIYERDEHNNPIAVRKLTDEETNKVWNYLYNLIYALTTKKRMFPVKEQYDEFCAEYASHFYMRLTREKQDFSPGAKRNKPIKSILNYLKNVLGFIAITYRERNYKEIIDPTIASAEEVEGFRNYTYSQADNCIIKNYNIIEEEHTEVFKKIDNTFDKILDKSIYKNNKRLRYYLKNSVYLSIINMLTLNNRYNKENKRVLSIQKQVDNREEYIIVFNNEITKEIVSLYMKKLLEKIGYQIGELDKGNELPEDTIQYILESAYNI